MLRTGIDFIPYFSLIFLHTFKGDRNDHSRICLLLRWGNTPLDDAVQFEKDSVVEVLKEYQRIYSHTLMPEEISTQAHGEAALDADDLGNMEILSDRWHQFLMKMRS